MRVAAALVAGAVAAASGAAASQAPRKARPEAARAAPQPAAPQPAAPQTARFSGAVAALRGRALPGMGETVTAFYAKRGEETRRFVVRLVEAGGLPKTVVTRGGKELTPEQIEEALNTDGLRVDVEHDPEPYGETEAYLAHRVKIGGFQMSTDATGNTSELQVEEIEVGGGREARPGDSVTVHYTGWLTDGTKFDSSHDRGEPFSFRLGERQVIRGWDLGVSGMRVGGKRKLTIPPGLGYGARGAGRSIPPNATLVFEVELLKVR